MRRKIIKINEELCNGCGDCVTDCAEGALQIINGKAKLIKQDYCDGLGACLKGCPTGALTIVEEEAPAFNEEAVKEHLTKNGHPANIKIKQTTQSSPLAHQGHKHGGGCPGSRIIDRQDERKIKSPAQGTITGLQAIPSELTQWPVQLHLVNPAAPYFSNRELVVLSTCSPTASADIHWRFIRGRSVVVLCPKLDKIDNYVEKLSTILSNSSIPKVLPVIMEVPCCKGLTQIVTEAVLLSGRTDLKIEEHVIGLDGSMKKITELN